MYLCSLQNVPDILTFEQTFAKRIDNIRWYSIAHGCVCSLLTHLVASPILEKCLPTTPFLTTYLLRIDHCWQCQHFQWILALKFHLVVCPCLLMQVQLSERIHAYSKTQQYVHFCMHANCMVQAAQSPHNLNHDQCYPGLICELTLYHYQQHPLSLHIYVAIIMYLLYRI